MMCFRDKTFCSASHCAKFHRCKSALTHEVQAAADKAGLIVSTWEIPEDLICFSTGTLVERLRKCSASIDTREADALMEEAAAFIESQLAA